MDVARWNILNRQRAVLNSDTTLTQFICCLPILCRVRRKTLTQSVCWVVCTKVVGAILSDCLRSVPYRYGKCDRTWRTVGAKYSNLDTEKSDQPVPCVFGDKCLQVVKSSKPPQQRGSYLLRRSHCSSGDVITDAVTSRFASTEMLSVETISGKLRIVQLTFKHL